ncbi:hypothetical protein Tco_1385089 [Tanacetum coccineum]
MKRYGEELQTKTSKKQRFDDKDVPVIGDRVAEVKEEEPVKRTGKRKKQKARKGRYQQGQRKYLSYYKSKWSLIRLHDFGAMIKDFYKKDLIECTDGKMQSMELIGLKMLDDSCAWSDLSTMIDPPLNEDAIWTLHNFNKRI